MLTEEKPILLIDAYNIFARAYCVVPIMSSHGHQLGGAVGFMKSLGMLTKKFRPSKIIVCWEGGGSARRRAILPEYKLNRKPIKLNRSDIYEDIPDTEENFLYQVALTTNLLKHIPVEQMYVEQCEADDIIAYIARYKYPNHKKIICSMDQDLHQCLSENCVQYSPASKKILDSNYVLERYGVSVQNFITARTFIGDTSDGIPGIKGCGFKSLVKRFPELGSEEFVSVDDILSLCKERYKQKQLKMYKNMLENSDVARRNWKIMQLDISNLSADHIQRLEYSIDTADTKRDKFGLVKALVAEGVDMPRAFNADVFFMNLNSSIAK
tara:strand:+ start:531 stop:1505 length:975 start_codon:yes stop_codon:yes gene_type:complete